jgi:hypothetical protein
MNTAWRYGFKGRASVVNDGLTTRVPLTSKPSVKESLTVHAFPCATATTEESSVIRGGLP